MSLVSPSLIFLVFALSTLAPAANAQTASAAPAQADAAGEAEFEAKADAFGVRMQQMGEEMEAAVTAAAGDADKQDADLDAIEARYQPDADAFGADLEAFINLQAATAPASERAGMAAAIQAAVPQIRSIPQQARTQIEAAAAQPAAAPPVS